ncbi:MFS transporter [Hydrocarboniphaga sp.]|uniref:MFS transporter n=1 Tax=Hydrocarboniphaga sp. TaxID=2033016 RepID=UPI0034514442
MLCASAMLMITMGGRQSMGLFIGPITQATGVGIVGISFALAIGQFVWGAVQPIFGAIADQYGARPVIFCGTLLLALGYVLVPHAGSQFGLMMTMGVLVASGAGAASFSILIGATASALPPEKRSFASGLINAGGSFGQFVFAPLAQLMIVAFGWVAAMYSLAAASLLVIPLLLGLGRRQTPAESPVTGVPAGAGLGAQLRVALRDRSYWLLHAGFFTCGVHIAFLVTHLPGEVSLCGLPASVSATSLALIGLFNVAGSLTAGALGSRLRMKYVLGAMYASRVLIIAIYLVSPRTPLTFYVFAAALGFSWLATVPPTAGLVGKLFGTRYLGTLFGLTLLSHQIGGFFGAWLGGVTIARFGDYNWMWYGDMLLAGVAALLCLPIREARMKSTAPLVA